MTNTEIIQAIRNEIERLYNDKSYSEDRWDMGYDCACEDMMSFLFTLESEKPVPSDLEEAAKAYADDINSNECLYTYTDFSDAFKAGASWQKERDEKELSEKIASAYQLGLADKEKKMMKEAVEGIVMNFSSNEPKPTVIVDAKGFNQGDRVGVIVCKKED